MWVHQIEMGAKIHSWENDVLMIFDSTYTEYSSVAMLSSAVCFGHIPTPCGGRKDIFSHIHFEA